jgi:hypothetical protein
MFAEINGHRLILKYGVDPLVADEVARAALD